MKIAICMSGLTRTFKHCYKSLLENIMDGNDCDVFTVVSDDINNEDLNLIPMVKKLCVKKSDMPFFDENKYKKSWNTNRANTRRYTSASLLEQYWKINECFKLAKEHETNNGIKYDWCIRCRPDLFYYKKMTPLIQELDNNFMYVYLHEYNHRAQIPYWENNSIKWFDKDFIYDYNFYYNKNEQHVGQSNIQDQFAISNMENMAVYSGKYDRLEDWKKNNPFFALHAYTNNYHALSEKNVKLKMARPFFRILRPEGFVQSSMTYAPCL
jgi:hypothetical protein